MKCNRGGGGGYEGGRVMEGGGLFVEMMVHGERVNHRVFPCNFKNCRGYGVGWCV